MSSTGSAAPGWYPDPSDASQLRYWDGAVWTEALAPAAGAQLADGSRPGAYGVPAEGSGSGLGDVGSWLSAVFSALMSRLGPIVLVLYVIPALGWIAIVMLVRSSVTGLSYDRATDEFTGFELGPIVVAAVLVVALILVSVIGWLAAQHQLYGAHAGQPPTFGRSLATGLRRLPRTIGWALVYVFAALLALAIVGAVIGLGIAAAGPRFLLILVLLGPALVVGGIWLLVRLALVGTALAVAPSGANPFRASWQVTQGRFWPVLGRLLLLWIIIYIISFATQLASQIAGVFVVGELDYQMDSVDGLVIDGQVVSDLDVISFDLFVPSAPILVGIVAVTILSQAISQALSVAGSAGLYYRGGGVAEL